MQGAIGEVLHVVALCAEFLQLRFACTFTARHFCLDLRRRGIKRMSLVAWIVLGLVAGFIAGKLVNHAGKGVVLDVVVGVLGAVVGGWLFHIFSTAGVTGLNVYSLIVAVVGAAVFREVLLGVRMQRRNTLKRTLAS
jgi:uncharacterized membrane protein YeaQ/YmgE (transglycosylase-associated protein family)